MTTTRLPSNKLLCQPLQLNQHQLIRSSINLHTIVSLLLYLPYSNTSRISSYLINTIWSITPHLVTQQLSNFFNSVYSSTQQKNVLITIRWSHYCEKARFMCYLLQSTAQYAYQNKLITEQQLMNYSYMEQSHTAILHIPYVYYATGGRSSHAPVLVTSPDNTGRRCVKYCSVEITEYIDTQLKQLYTQCKSHIFPYKIELIPSDPMKAQVVQQFIDTYNHTYGSNVRGYVYSALWNADNPHTVHSQVKSMFTSDISTLESTIVHYMYDYIKCIMSFGMKINANNTAAYRHATEQMFDIVNNLLSDGRQYICGTDTLNAADITFITLSYSLISCVQCESIRGKSDINTVGDELMNFIHKHSDSRATKYAQHIYNQYRGGTVNTMMM